MHPSGFALKLYGYGRSTGPSTLVSPGLIAHPDRSPHASKANEIDFSAMPKLCIHRDLLHLDEDKAGITYAGEYLEKMRLIHHIAADPRPPVFEAVYAKSVKSARPVI